MQKAPLVLRPPSNLEPHPRPLHHLPSNVPRQEENRERWKSEDISRLAMERFPEIGRYYVSLFLLSCLSVYRDIRVAEGGGKRKSVGNKVEANMTKSKSRLA
jgi:hypothetical protein